MDTQEVRGLKATINGNVMNVAASWLRPNKNSTKGDEMSTWSEMNDSIKDIGIHLNEAKKSVRQMSYVLAGNLRSCEVEVKQLRELKRELKGFNSSTGQWKE
jgi:hypothetical protein